MSCLFNVTVTSDYLKKKKSLSVDADVNFRARSMFRSGSSAGTGFCYSWLGLTENIKKTTPLLEMIATRIWKLKRYGRFIPGSKETGVTPWKVTDLHLHITKKPCPS